MAEPPRRSLLAKLRGKRAKKVVRGGEGRALTDSRSVRPAAAACAGGKQGRCLNGGTQGGGGGGVSGLRDARAEPRRAREQLAGGDSIGFGDGFGPRRAAPEAPAVSKGPCEAPRGWDGAVVLDQGASSVRLRAGPAEIIRGHLLEPSVPELLHLLSAEDLVQSSLQGEPRTPTFFPTELDIVDPSVSARLVWDREGTSRHDSVDSEDEDYYDNEILPFYDPGHLGDPPSPVSGCLGEDVSARETDRLRTQLKEAYYLLIHTMHGMAFSGQPESGSSSVRSVSPARIGESDSSSSGQHSSQSNCALLDLRGTRLGCTDSRSLQSLVPKNLGSPLHRSLSDSAVHYSCGPSQGDVSGHRTNMDLASEPGTNLGAPCREHPERSSPVVTEVSALDSRHRSDSVGSSADSQDVPAQKPVSQAASHSVCTTAPAKPPGVTVNKMQEWMHKGRVLSSEMRQRIAGSSLRGPPVQDSQARPGAVHTGKPANAGGPQPGLMFGGGFSSRECCPRSAPLNSITVSKKRNWLHQSSTQPLPQPDDIPASHSSDDDHALPTVVLSADASPPRYADPAEENDADDEGEIWYNPIPEDEEVDLPHCLLPVQPRPAGRPGAAPRWAEEGRVAEGGGGAGAGAGSLGEAPKANVTHSCEQRQMCRPDVQEIVPARTGAAEPPEQSVPGLSPPSSPNPAKKSCSINWSLPDRIKSPRTVRKLSMKMKKLPELSRKLSVKGNPVSSAGVASSQSENRIPPVKVLGVGEPSTAPPGGVATASVSGNVICRYHLDSSVSTQQHSYSKKKGGEGGVPKSASKGGYLSDGDSPELVAKSSKHGSSEGKAGRVRDRETGAPKTELDVDAFRPYNFTEQPKCTAYISGLMSLHFYGAEGLKPPRADSRHVYCAIQVDSVNKARTALLTCRTAFLDMDHTFNIELENAQHLKLALFSWEAAPRRNRICCHGTVVLPPLFRTVARTHQLAVHLEPRGTIYVKLGMMEQWQNSLDGPESERPANVFGVEASRVVEREGAGLMVPLIIEKCIGEIERRGCQVVGLYRLCGSAAVKKELREAFERDSRAVELSENNYPDINVITGVLKDYLRELPSPLISKPLYEAVLDTMGKRPLLIGAGGCENDQADTEHTVRLLETLPEVEKVTLLKLLDHLKRVASHHEVNKMTCQNLAVCFGPVLLSQRQDASCHTNRVFLDSEELASALHFKKHIEVLHYLLQLWPVVDAQGEASPALDTSVPTATVTAAMTPVRRRKERPQVLNLTDPDLAGVLRPRPGRLDSPSNRYAGDWSDCRETYLQQPCPDEADYDDVPSEGTTFGEREEERAEEAEGAASEQDAGDIDEAVEGAENTQAEEEKGESDKEQEAEENVPQQQEEVEEPVLKPWGHQIFLERDEHRAKEHTYQAYMKIQEISPVLSNRVNLRDLQESIDTLIGNLERELNKNKLNMGY